MMWWCLPYQQLAAILRQRIGSGEAEDVEIGDHVLYDGRVIEVTDTRLGFYRFPEGRIPGVSIGWKAGCTAIATRDHAAAWPRRLRLAQAAVLIRQPAAHR